VLICRLKGARHQPHVNSTLQLPPAEATARTNESSRPSESPKLSELMASEIPEYFLPRNWDFPPNGPIKLGNVLTSLKKPHRPLVTIKPDTDKIVYSPKDFVKIETESSRSGGFSILTTFLSGLLGLGVDAGADVERRFVEISAQSIDLIPVSGTVCQL